MVRFVNTPDEFMLLKARQDAYTIFDFTASWCGPCQKIGPVFEALAKDCTVEGKLEFYKVDVDENSGAAGESRVTKMPTFQVYNNGVLIYVMEGASEQNLKSMVDLTSRRMRGVLTDASS